MPGDFDQTPLHVAVLKENLEMQIERLSEEIDNKKATIQKARELIKMLGKEDSVWYGMCWL